MKTEIERKTVNLKLLRELRKRHHYTQTQVAKIIGLTSTDKYTRRENGDYNFQASELMALSELYGVKMEKFFA
ncbi:helix-turn-helix transcriptional regulator [Lactiplantibacillus plantarum]